MVYLVPRPHLKCTPRRVLLLLGSRFGTLLLAGRNCLTQRWPFVLPFPKLSLKRRLAIITSWRDSRITFFKKVFAVLLGLTSSNIL